MAKKPRRATRRGAEHEEPAPAPRSAVLPAHGDAESASAWGEDADTNDSRLLENLPPHWGR